MNINTLCFSSGGIQGVCFLSALKFLVDIKYIILETINITKNELKFHIYSEIFFNVFLLKK